MRPVEHHVKESVKLLVEVGVLALAIYLFVFQISIVKGNSMAPTFGEGDRLVIDKLTYRLAAVRRFDVIVFRGRWANHKDYIKRVIGLPGETVQVRSGALFIDGRRVIQDFSFIAQRSSDLEPIGVGPDEYFVLGDNRPSSTDSRERRNRQFGPVLADDIRGRVRLRVWPLDRLAVF